MIKSTRDRLEAYAAFMKDTKKYICESNEIKYNVEKYYFNGRGPFKKRSVVLETITQYLKDNPEITIEKFNDVFNPRLQGSLGVIREVKEAEATYHPIEKRFFVDNKVTIGNNEYYICKEWDSKNFENFLNTAKELGYEIVAAD